MRDIVYVVERSAHAHFDVVSAELARRQGLARPGAQRLADSGRWQRLLRGIYWTRPGGAPPATVLASAVRLFAGGGVLPAGTVGDELAARLTGLADGCPTVRPSVVLPESVWRRQPHGVRYRFETLAAADVTTVRGLVCTSPVRTLLDLAGSATLGDQLAMVDRGLRRGLLRVGPDPRLASVGRAWRWGDARSESAFESHVRAEILAAGLPPPSLQHVVSGRGAFIARVDLAWPDRRLAVEADGAATHIGADALRRDLRRQNALVEAGWTVIRFTWSDLGSIAPVVRRALSAQRPAA